MGIYAAKDYILYIYAITLQNDNAYIVHYY